MQSLASSTAPPRNVAGLADPWEIANAALDLLLPSPDVSVSDCALQHRKLENFGGGYVGRWKHDLVPYLPGPMDALTSKTHTAVAVIGPGQSAKTTIAENWMLWGAKYNPANLLWYMQTEEVLADYLDQRIDPMVRMHEDLWGTLGKGRGENTRAAKKFGRMRVSWFSATNSNLISKSAPWIVADEIDAYPANLGDVFVKLKVRMQTFGRNAMMLVLSHPDRGEGAGIMSVFEDSDQRLWWWRCAQCGATSSPAPIASRRMTLHYPREAPLDEIVDAARLVCPVNGCLIEDEDRVAMNAEAQWIGRGQEISVDGKVSGTLVQASTAGFWIHGFMVPFVHIGELARDLEKARRTFERTRVEKSLREVICKRFGEPYNREQVGKAPVKTDALKERPQTYPFRTVPDGVRFLTAAVDVGGKVFDVGVIGWGADGEHWWIDRFAIRQTDDLIDIDPGNVSAHWRLLDSVVTGAYPLASDPDRELEIACTAIDTGGVPGVSLKAGEYGRDLLVEGTDAWRVMLVKGGSNPKAPPIGNPSWFRDADGKRREDLPPLYVLGVNAIKSVVDMRMRKDEPGPGFMHFPKDMPPRTFTELTNEREVDEVWVRYGPQESFDIAVYAEAARQLLAPERVDWSNPPGWAKPRARRSETVDAGNAQPVAAKSSNRRFAVRKV